MNNLPIEFVEIDKEFKNSKINISGSGASEDDSEKDFGSDKMPQEHEDAFSAFDKDRKRPVLEILLKDLGMTVFPKAGCKKAQEKMILQKVNAVFSPGKMIAVMGSSGSGKTTLMNILGRRIGGKMSGEVLVNGKPMDKLFFKNSSYVLQHDLLLPFLTVHETLMYAARLRLPKHLDMERKSKIVEQVIKVLNLDSCRDTRIGGEGIKGVSGGQKKRVSIGQELLTDPAVILLDEPTSGLDSATSINLIRSLKDFAAQGRTIVASIHQPSAEMFFLFDKVLLLANGNQVFYGSPKKMVPYFAKHGYQCPDYQNPADYVLNLITSGYELIKDEKSIPSAEITKELIEAYKVEYQNNQDIISGHSSTSLNIRQLEEGETVLPPTEFSRFVTLFQRGIQATSRNPAATIAKVFQSVFFSLLFGLVYLKIGDYQVDIRDRLGSLYFIVINAVMPNLMQNLFMFPSQRALFLREKATNSYGVVTYYLSKICVDLPFQLIFPILFSCIVYFMIGYQTNAAKFFIFAFCIVVLTHTAVTMAVGISAAVGSFELALVVAPVVVLPLLVLGGFIIRSCSIPIFLQWLQYLSPFKYGFEILTINEFTGLTLTCMQSELVNGVCPVTDGSQVIPKYLDSGASIWRGFVIVLSLAVGFHLIAIFFLYINSRKLKS